MFFGMRRRFTSWLYLLFMLVMTPLTLYLWLTNPVEDCGCFGDAITLTHAETFIKNIVLLLMSWVVFRYFRLMTRFISERNQWTISLYSIVFGLILACVSLYRLPVFDFRPYHVGADLKAAMEIPEGLEGPVYETTFVMEKDGVREEFTLEDYPDDTWTFIESKTKMVSEGFIPEIHDFSIILTPEGEDITMNVLADTSYTFLLIAPHLEEADDSNVDRTNELYDYIHMVMEQTGHDKVALSPISQGGTISNALFLVHKIKQSEFSLCFLLVFILFAADVLFRLCFWRRSWLRLRSFFYRLCLRLSFRFCFFCICR